jgi:spoIIIJ-associated protein
MEWVETTGRTIEEAKDAALDQLGVDEHDAEFEILEEPRVGLFGRLRAEARVRARVRPTVPRPKEDRRDRRRRQSAHRGGESSTSHRTGESGSSRSGRSGGRSGSAASSSADPPSAADETGAGDRETSRSDTAVLAAGRGQGPDRASSRSARRRRNRGRRSAADGRNDGRADGRTDDDEEGSGMTMPLAEQGSRAREFLEGLVEEFGMEATFTVEELDEDTVEVRLEGEGLGLLIGPKGQTLAALQELTRCAVQQAGGRGRLLVDVAGYRQKRKDALERFARQIADEVRGSGQRRTLEPMSAADRKIVHDTVNELADVATTSEGEEPRRYVVILPASSGPPD